VCFCSRSDADVDRRVLVLVCLCSLLLFLVQILSMIYQIESESAFGCGTLRVVASLATDVAGLCSDADKGGRPRLDAAVVQVCPTELLGAFRQCWGLGSRPFIVRWGQTRGALLRLWFG
jgi:hypothetical protein